jgi:hypothetical protein
MRLKLFDGAFPAGAAGMLPLRFCLPAEVFGVSPYRYGKFHGSEIGNKKIPQSAGSCFVSDNAKDGP